MKSDTENERLAAVLIGIVVVEFVVILGLYWFGVHFL
jgi:hypothetical protein